VLYTLLTDALHVALREMDKSVPRYRVSTLEDYVSKSAAQPRFQTLLITCFAGIALLLAAVGLYGLLSYMVAQGTLEIGVRMALGAKRNDVLAMVVWRGLEPYAHWISGGTVNLRRGHAPAIGNALRHPAIRSIHVFGYDGRLTSGSLAASSIPAFRAAQLDPLASLREQ
jgi:putative ABC transport system permease protein